MRSVLRVVSKCITEKIYLDASRGMSISSHFILNPAVKESKLSEKTGLLHQKSTLPTQRYMGTYITIKHIHNKFFIELDDIQAVLIYSIVNGVMEIKSTRVPKKFGGHGLGKLLAKEALEFAIENDLRIKITCGFVQLFVDEIEPSYLKYIYHKRS